MYYSSGHFLDYCTAGTAFIQFFSNDTVMMEAGVPALKVYFFGFVFMALQFSGQSAFQALGDAKHAIFFFLLRKVFIVVPLTLLLPKVGFGVMGVFMAEPISNVIGGLAGYLTMRKTIYRQMKEKELGEKKENVCNL